MKKEMIEYEKYVPHDGIPFVVETTWGEERKAVLDRFSMGYRFTDCTHPMQNCHLSSFDIVKWRYINEQEMIDLNFSENTWEREKYAANVINNVKATYLDKIKYKINNMWVEFRNWDKIKQR